MQAAVILKDGMVFEGQVGDHSVVMDAKAPLGKESAPTPKELVALGLGGCTAMDVIALLRKHKQTPTAFRVEIAVDSSRGKSPVVFEKSVLRFVVDGTVEASTLLEAVRLSQTKYCGVSAMLSQAHPIEYIVVLNGEEIGTGKADFESTEKESA